MTVSTTIAQASFDWTGVETSFACGFPAAQLDDVDVVSVDGDGVETPLTRDVHYSATLAPSTKLVTLAPIALPAAPKTIIARRNSELLQSVVFEEGYAIPQSSHQSLHDSHVLRDQELRRDIEKLRTTVGAEYADDANAAAVAAQGAAALAGDKADDANASAVAAGVALGAALDAQGAAENARDDAEAARDASFDSSGTYASTAAGIAATSNGEQFDVVEGEEIQRYLNNSGVAEAIEGARRGTTASVAKKTTIAAIAEAYDLETDRLAPFFINVRDFTKSHVTPATFNVATIASRDSDTQFTVNAGQGSNFVANGACVILDGDGNYHSVAIQSVAGDVVTAAEPLPATCVSAQTMHETTNGQHLSNYGYNGLADFIATRVERYSYRKAHLIWHWHPPITKSIAFNDPKIYALDGVTVVHNPTILGGASGGGFVEGTTAFVKELRASSADENVTAAPLSYYLSRSYLIRQGTAGKGIKFTIPVSKIGGYLEIPVAAERVLYDTSLFTAGRARILVTGDGATIADQTVDVGPMRRLFVDFNGASDLDVSIMLADSVPTSIRSNGVYVWGKSAETSSVRRLFRRGDRVAFFGDSWTQFPAAPPGSGLTRPDGSTGDGYQFLSERLRARLAVDGIQITTLNMGKGGTTSAWLRYWVKSLLSISPRPNKCVLQSWPNDYNSNAFALTGADTAYDFDPSNQWAFKTQSTGGLRGSVTYDEWFENIIECANVLSLNGIKPIILMPCHTGAGAQTQGVQQNMLNKIAVGFRNINELGGRE